MLNAKSLIRISRVLTSISPNTGSSSTDEIHESDKRDQGHLSNTKYKAVHVEQLPHARRLPFVTSQGRPCLRHQLRSILHFFGVTHSLYATLISLSSSLTAGEYLLGRVLTNRVQQPTFGKLAGDALIDAVLGAVDILIACDLGLIEFV